MPPTEQPNTMNDMGESVSVPMPLDRADGICYGTVSIALGIAWVFSAKNPYSGGWLFVVSGAFRVLWWSLAKYAVSVSETALSITRSVLGFRWRGKNYPLNEISNLRVGQRRIFNSTYAMLMFERNGKNKAFGELSGLRLNTSSETWLDPVYQRFPNLRSTQPNPKDS